jgi:hypothetical protein
MGVETCVAGVFGACSAGTPGPEVCNGVDDDCDGRIDEGARAPIAVTVCTGAECPSRTGYDVCNATNVLAQDGSEMGIGFTGSGSILVDDVPVTSCVLVEFSGMAALTGTLRVRARTVDAVCASACSGGLCNTVHSMEVFHSPTGTSWRHAGPAGAASITGMTDTLADYTVVVDAVMRFALLCRINTSSVRDHLAIDFVEATVCP